MKFLLIGASRNIGYYAALRLLSQGHTCIFLLRNPSTFDNDNTIQEYVKSGIAKLVKGDATVEEQVRNVWRVALEDGKGVDTILFTLGASSGK
jgi:NAD(P)-dependent dehydrogenase (short-subunit alcohol dehydrogenase family)